MFGNWAKNGFSVVLTATAPFAFLRTVDYGSTGRALVRTVVFGYAKWVW